MRNWFLHLTLLLLAIRVCSAEPEAASRPLVVATRQGDLAGVQAALPPGAALDDSAGSGGRLIQDALVAAVQHGEIEIVRFLLSRGADPNGMNGQAMLQADLLGEVEIFDALRAAGGHPQKLPTRDVSSARKNTAKHSDIVFGTSEIVPPSARVVATQKAEPRNSVRLAILADTASQDAAATLLSELSSYPHLALVERDEIERVLAEKSNVFTANPSASVAVGQLLGADCLVILNSKQSSSGVLRQARLVRTQPGVVLDAVFSPATAGTVSDWARAVALRFAEKAEYAIRPKMNAVAFAGLRAVHASGRSVEQLLNLLVPARLSGTPEVTLLDRASLDKLAEEGALTAGEDFWQARFVVSGTLDVDLSGTRNIRAKLTVTRVGAVAPPVTVESVGTESGMSVLVRDIAEKIRRVVASTPSAESLQDSREDSGFYLQQARWALDCKLPFEAYQYATLARYLGPKSPDTGLVYARSCAALIQETASVFAHESAFGISNSKLWSYGDAIDRVAQETGSPDLAQVLSLANSSLSALQEFREVGDGPGSGVTGQNAEEIAAAALVALTLCDTANLKQVHADAFRQVRAGLRSFVAEYLAPGHAQSDSARFKLAQLLAATIPLWASTDKERSEAVHWLGDLVFTESNDRLRAAIRLEIFQSVYQAIVTLAGGGFLEVLQARRYSVWRQIASELLNSDSAEDRWAARQLQWVTAEPESRPPAAEMLKAVWDLRKKIAADPLLFSSVSFHFKFSNANTASPELVDRATGQFTPEAMQWRRKLFIELTHSSDQLVQFSSLLDTERYSPEEKAEVVGAIRAALLRINPRTETGLNTIRYFATIFPEAKLSGLAPQEEPLWFRKFWHPLDLGLGNPKEFAGGSFSLCWAEDRVWYYGEFAPNSGRDDVVRRFVFSVKVPTLETEAIEIPSRVGSRTPGPMRLAVTRDYIYACGRMNGLCAYNRNTRQWTLMAELNPLSAGIAVSGNSLLFLEGGEKGTSLLRFDPEKQTVTVVASSRRLPAETPLDSSELILKDLVQHTNGEIEIEANNQESYPNTKRMDIRYEPVSGKWTIVRELQPIPKDRPVALKPALGFEGRGLVQSTVVLNSVATAWELVTAGQDGKERRVPVSFDPHLETAKRFGPESRAEFSADYTWHETPAGYVVGESMGKGFWYLSKEEFRSYLAAHPDVAGN